MDIAGWVDYTMRFGLKYPGLIALGVGTVSAWALGALVEAYYLPPSMPLLRQQKAWASAITILGAWVGSAAAWTVMAPTDPLGLRFYVIAAVLAPDGAFQLCDRWARPNQALSENCIRVGAAETMNLDTYLFAAVAAAILALSAWGYIEHERAAALSADNVLLKANVQTCTVAPIRPMSARSQRLRGRRSEICGRRKGQCRQRRYRRF